MKKEIIIEQIIMENIRRKNVDVDHVQVVEGEPFIAWLEINPTELCNRTCTFCPRVDPDDYPNQNLNMTVTLAKKMADELFELEYQGSVAFSGYGEPLLTPNIEKIINQFGDINVEVVTNGDPLNKKMIKDLYDAGLNTLVTSMYDGPFQIDKFKKLFKDAGISEDKYVLRERWFGEDEDFGLLLTNRSGTVNGGNQPAVNPMKRCFYTHYSMVVDWNGDVLLCTQDWNKKVKFGNIYSNTLLESWQSSGLSKYRRTLGKGFRKYEPCKSCNVDGTLMGSNHAEAWDNKKHR